MIVNCIINQQKHPKNYCFQIFFVFVVSLIVHFPVLRGVPHNFGSSLLFFQWHCSITRSIFCCIFCILSASEHREYKRYARIRLQLDLWMVASSFHKKKGGDTFQSSWEVSLGPISWPVLDCWFFSIFLSLVARTPFPVPSRSWHWIGHEDRDSCFRKGSSQSHASLCRYFERNRICRCFWWSSSAWRGPWSFYRNPMRLWYR